MSAQLRTPKDTDGAPTGLVPPIADSTDAELRLGERRFVIRTWVSWVAVMSQSCEFVNRNSTDSRVHLAPVIFRQAWDGDQWSVIRDGTAAGFLYLPKLTDKDRTRSGGSTRGWPDDEGAIVISSMTLASERVLTGPRFSLTTNMQAALQRQLVSFFSVRDWKADKQREELVGKRIREVAQTYERVGGPAPLYKVMLTDADDELSVVLMSFRP